MSIDLTASRMFIRRPVVGGGKLKTMHCEKEKKS